MTRPSVLLGFVGDLLVDRDEPLAPFADVRALLDAPHVLFGNLEGAFSDDPRPPASHHFKLNAPAHNLDAFAAAGFDVLSMANNHVLDAGPDAMLLAIERLRAAGVKTCGAGPDLQCAREPAIVEAENMRIAFLAYASVFPVGYEALDDRPGLAPLRARDTYLPHRDYHLPGTFPHIRSEPDAGDLEALRCDIARARGLADLVITSFHWGDMLHPFLLTDHERRTARWCIEHGADMVVGHHHHALRGIEWHAGRPILYGLGHFVFDCRAVDPNPRLTGFEYAPHPREGWPLLPMHPDTRMTVMACAAAGPGGIEEIGFVPCRLRPDGRVQAVHPDSDEGREVVAYLRRCNVSQQINGRIEPGVPWPIGDAWAVRVVAGAPV